MWNERTLKTPKQFEKEQSWGLTSGLRLLLSCTRQAFRIVIKTNRSVKNRGWKRPRHKVVYWHKYKGNSEKTVFKKWQWNQGYPYAWNKNFDPNLIPIIKIHKGFSPVPSFKSIHFILDIERSTRENLCQLRLGKISQVRYQLHNTQKKELLNWISSKLFKSHCKKNKSHKKENHLQRMYPDLYPKNIKNSPNSVRKQVVQRNQWANDLYASSKKLHRWQITAHKNLLSNISHYGNAKK